MRGMVRIRFTGASIACLLLASLPAPAQVPAAAQLLGEVGFSPAEVARIEGGQLMPMSSIQPSSPRELVAAFAFYVHAKPGDIVADLRKGLLDRVDPNTLAFAMLPANAGLADFAKLTLAPDPPKQAQAYVAAKPGGGLNPSSAEIATMNALGTGAPAR